MSRKPERLILLSTLLVSFSCRADDSVSPATLDDEVEGRFYSVSSVPVDPTQFEVTISIAAEGTKFFLNSDRVDGNATHYTGQVEIEDGGTFTTTNLGAVFHDHPSAPFLSMIFHDPLTPDESPVNYNFYNLTSADPMPAYLTYVPIGGGSDTYTVEGALTKGRLGTVAAP